MTEFFQVSMEMIQSCHCSFRGGDTETKGGTGTYPRSLSKLVADLEVEPMDTLFTQTHMLTSRYTCVNTSAITLIWIVKQETDGGFSS